jgi:Asp-tRNA(Asn)/Glu-tRNA(Gln) amidotransferase B subunit
MSQDETSEKSSESNPKSTPLTTSDGKGITAAAAKFIYRAYAEHFKTFGTVLEKTPEEIADECDLWLADEWTHVGFCILVCLENQKLVDTYKKGNTKVFDALVGKTIKMANMTVDPELVRELLPVIIAAHF